MNNNLLNTIRETGLADKEARVYLALLELSRGTVSQISELTGLKRPIIYVMLEKLIKSGYATQLPNKRINQYQALDPSIIFTKERLALKNFSEMLPFLQTLGNEGNKKPKIHYIDTKKGIVDVYEEMNVSKEAFFISSYTKLEKFYPDIVSGWIKNYKKGRYDIIGKHLIPDDPKEIKIGKEFAKMEQIVKILPGIKHFDMDFTLYRNKLAITSLEENYFMVLIESQGLVDSMKPIFEIAWRAGRPV